MKDSGIKWIGLIPEDWDLIPNKYLFTEHSSKVGTRYSDYQLLSLTTSGVKEKDVNTSTGKVPESYDNYQTVEPGDMVFCLFDLDCSAVFSGLSNIYGMITSAYDVLKPNHKYLDNRYADFWFQYVFSNRYYKTYSKNIRYSVTKDTFSSILTPVPPIEQQQRIADFLDEKCGKIDELIAIHEKQIEQLKQYKQSIITEAVTKGIDNLTTKQNGGGYELSSNFTVPLKDSGIEWIGKVPSHWDIVLIDGLFELRNQKVSDKDFMPLSVTMKGVVPQLETAAKTNDGDNRKLVCKGDFAINSRSDRRGSCGISDYDGSVSLINTILKPRQKICANYYNWFFHTPIFADEFYKWGHGIVDDLWTTTWSEMKRISIPFPPFEEQQQIANALNTKCANIDSLISIKGQKIETLQEYKKTLIYEYVTGQKEVA